MYLNSGGTTDFLFALNQLSLIQGIFDFRRKVYVIHLR